MDSMHPPSPTARRGTLVFHDGDADSDHASSSISGAAATAATAATAPTGAFSFATTTGANTTAHTTTTVSMPQQSHRDARSTAGLSFGDSPCPLAQRELRVRGHFAGKTAGAVSNPMLVQGQGHHGHYQVSDDDPHGAAPPAASSNAGLFDSSDDSPCPLAQHSLKAPGHFMPFNNREAAGATAAAATAQLQCPPPPEPFRRLGFDSTESSVQRDRAATIPTASTLTTAATVACVAQRLGFAQQSSVTANDGSAHLTVVSASGNNASSFHNDDAGAGEDDEVVDEDEDEEERNTHPVGPTIGAAAAFQRSNVVLGKGGSATVYLGRTKLTHTLVAVKKRFMSRNRTAVLAAGEEEHEILAAIPSHKNVIALLGACEGDGCTLFAMELMESDLSFEMKHGMRLTPPQVRAVMFDVLTAIAHVNGHNIAHRDIKASNVLLTKDDSERAGVRVVLGDFGVAHYATDADRPAMSYRGTRFYQPPEALYGSVDPSLVFACDSWAAGCLLYELQCGKPPFCAEASVEMLRIVFAGLGSSFAEWIAAKELRSENASQASQASQQAQTQPPAQSSTCVSPENDSSSSQNNTQQQRATKRPPLFDALAQCSEDMKDLLARLLDLDPTTRMTAAEALSHPYFHGMSDSSSSSTAAPYTGGAVGASSAQEVQGTRPPRLESPSSTLGDLAHKADLSVSPGQHNQVHGDQAVHQEGKRDDAFSTRGESMPSSIAVRSFSDMSAQAASTAPSGLAAMSERDRIIEATIAGVRSFDEPTVGHHEAHGVGAQKSEVPPPPPPCTPIVLKSYPQCHRTVPLRRKGQTQRTGSSMRAVAKGGSAVGNAAANGGCEEVCQQNHHQHHMSESTNSGGDGGHAVDRESFDMHSEPDSGFSTQHSSQHNSERRMRSTFGLADPSRGHHGSAQLTSSGRLAWSELLEVSASKETHAGGSVMKRNRSFVECDEDIGCDDEDDQHRSFMGSRMESSADGPGAGNPAAAAQHGASFSVSSTEGRKEGQRQYVIPPSQLTFDDEDAAISGRCDPTHSPAKGHVTFSQARARTTEGDTAHQQQCRQPLPQAPPSSLPQHDSFPRSHCSVARSARSQASYCSSVLVGPTGDRIYFHDVGSPGENTSDLSLQFAGGNTSGRRSSRHDATMSPISVRGGGRPVHAHPSSTLSSSWNAAAPTAVDQHRLQQPHQLQGPSHQPYVDHANQMQPLRFGNTSGGLFDSIPRQREVDSQTAGSSGHPTPSQALFQQSPPVDHRGTQPSFPQRPSHAPLDSMGSHTTARSGRDDDGDLNRIAAALAQSTQQAQRPSVGFGGAAVSPAAVSNAPPPSMYARPSPMMVRSSLPPNLVAPPSASSVAPPPQRQQQAQQQTLGNQRTVSLYEQHSLQPFTHLKGPAGSGAAPLQSSLTCPTFQAPESRRGAVDEPASSRGSENGSHQNPPVDLPSSHPSRPAFGMQLTNAPAQTAQKTMSASTTRGGHPMPTFSPSARAPSTNGASSSLPSSRGLFAPAANGNARPFGRVFPPIDLQPTSAGGAAADRGSKHGRFASPGQHSPRQLHFGMSEDEEEEDHLRCPPVRRVL